MLAQLVPVLNNYKDLNFRTNKPFEIGAMHTKGIAKLDLLLAYRLTKSSKIFLSIKAKFNAKLCLVNSRTAP